MTVHEEENVPHDEPIADADLILRTRSGDTEAFGELWRRHYPSGIAVARSVTSSIDPDDLVQESYTRIYQAIVKGGGPNGSFRAYLFTSIRNTAAAWGRSRRESTIDELDSVADPDSTDQAANEALDRSLTAQAFRSLPSRWQEVLWYTEIEQMKPQDVAPLLGMKSGAVSQLAFRAREGLREAWIQAHLRSAAPGSDCQWTIEHLGAYSRGNLSARDYKRLELHLDECARCMIVAAEAKDVSKRLALVLLPLVLGITGSAGYLATLQGGGAPIVALAAAPSGIPGVVVAGDPGATASTAGAAAGTGAGNGSGGAAGGNTAAGGSAGSAGGGAATGGMLTGMGALVGAGSAALVVAGVVAAATIIPGLAGAQPAASQPNAGDSDPSSIASDVGPDTSMTLDEPVVIDEPATEPKDDAAPPATETQTDPVEPSGPVTAPTTPTVPEKPVTPVDPVDPVDPIDPVDPAVPTAPPVWSVATVWFEGFIVHYSVPITGAPGATIEALLDGSSSGGDSIELDETGAGVIDLRPDLWQFIDPASTTVTFRYVLATGPGPAADTTLFALEGGVEITFPEQPTEEPPVELPAETGPADETDAPETVTISEAPVEEAPVVETTPLASEQPAPATAPTPETDTFEPTAVEPTTVPPTAVEPAAAATAVEPAADSALPSAEESASAE